MQNTYSRYHYNICIIIWNVVRCYECELFSYIFGDIKLHKYLYSLIITLFDSCNILKFTLIIHFIHTIRIITFYLTITIK